MKKILILISIVTLVSCGKDYLDVSPKAQLTSSVVSSADPEGLVNAAYASLGNDHYDSPFSLWPYGNVRSGDAYKGGRDNADIGDFYDFEIFIGAKSSLGEIDALWYSYYKAIARVNAALKVLDSKTEAEFPLKKVRQAEMRFLRGHNYFQLKQLYKFIPYIDETVDVNNYGGVSNVALSNDSLWEKIAVDFQFATNTLPATQSDLGRPTKYAAMAYLAKTRLFQAYHQDNLYNSPNAHAITSINTAELNKVVTLADSIIGSGLYSLQPDFANNFVQGAFENGVESLFSIQYSLASSIQYGRLNFGDLLSAPEGIGCCDFQKPSQNLANSYKTDVNGLPRFLDFNSSKLDLTVDFVDPRLDHTIAIPKHLWKYDQTVVYDSSWNRSPDIYGYFASLKENVQKGKYVQVGPFYANDKNRIVIRYADVLLWKAEALIELSRQNEALSIINQVRTRAGNSTGLLKFADGTYESNYKIGTYQDGVNCTWTQDFARNALRWERRLEFALEGHRFFDLVRWGIADTYLNTYFQGEKTVRAYLKDGLFTKNRDEYLPIPYNQINFSHGVYKQNVGYSN